MLTRLALLLADLRQMTLGDMKGKQIPLILIIIFITSAMCKIFCFRFKIACNTIQEAGSKMFRVSPTNSIILHFQ